MKSYFIRSWLLAVWIYPCYGWLTSTTIVTRGKSLVRSPQTSSWNVRPSYTSSFKVPIRISTTLTSHNNNNMNNNDKRKKNDNKDMLDAEEKSRLLIWENRRESIRSVLRWSESVKIWRQTKDDNNDNNNNNDSMSSSSSPSNAAAAKTAVAWTAFGVAAGAVALRVGGRAALVSAVGLDFAKDNPELKDQLEYIIQYAQDTNTALELVLFVVAWTLVKVLCFDAGGIVLALSSGIVFGGVWQGALASSTAATIGSYVCFTLAKLDTPIRAKALQIVEEYPSLRGIEKVVAQDGFKAILTLRLAPILPIPLGLYNYVYGVTNVPVGDFLAGIFLGSFKPYLLDSYLGYFGKSVVDGTAGDTMGLQDIILLVVLGVSVLIGVFASQLAGETWEVVLQEIDVERKAKLAEITNNNTLDTKDEVKVLMDALGVRTKVVDGLELPNWVVEWQILWGVAEERMKQLVEDEFAAKVWNCTDSFEIPPEIDPARQPNSPEITEIGYGVDIGQSVIEGMTLTPVLVSAFWKYSEPSYMETATTQESENMEIQITYAKLMELRKTMTVSNTKDRFYNSLPSTKNDVTSRSSSESSSMDLPLMDRDAMLRQIANLQSRAQWRLQLLESMLESEKTDIK
jgi:uncharacterized membrane protein YdjX (TVP38/TMEM64 family)